MGKFVEINKKDIVKYQALTDKPFGKIMALEQYLKFYKFQPCGNIKFSEVFYDTPNDMLTKTGILLSRVQEDDKVYFKVAPMKTIKSAPTSKVFAHKVLAKDKLKDHAFYLVDGIKGLFNTPFSIDLENVIKNSVPKIAYYIDSQCIRVISGSGFRSYMCLEDIRYENFDTKRQEKSHGLTVKLDSPAQYMTEFETFNAQIKKHCKDFVEMDDEIFNHIKNMTKKIDPKQARIDAKKAKEKISQEMKSSEE